jgi:hypothetical protein
MSHPEDTTIERITDLDLGVDELWELISTEHGWSSWLVDEAHLIIQPGCTGTAVDDGVVREVRVDSISDRRGIGFSWWDRDDPSSVSFVHLTIVELPSGRSQLHITEQFVGGTSAMAMAPTTAVAWEVRLVSLWLLALHSTVLA